jgi:hypothetical protein
MMKEVESPDIIPKRKVLQQKKMSMHLDNIQHYKNTMLMTVSRDFELGNKNMDKIEERITESKNQIRMDNQLNQMDMSAVLEEIENAKMY